MPVGQNRDYSTFSQARSTSDHKIGGIDYRPPDVIIGHEVNFVPALFTYSKPYFLKHTMNSGSFDNPLPVEKIDFAIFVHQ